jgi:hypothetical protein
MDINIDIDIKPYYLQFTSALLLIPYFYYILKEKENKNTIENMLCMLLLLVVFFSQLFWNYPIKKSAIHIIDAYIAKTAILCFFIYTLFFKKNIKQLIIIYIFLILLTSYTFYKSNYHSSRLWCSNEHLFFHGSSHLLCVLTSFFAFI